MMTELLTISLGASLLYISFYVTPRVLFSVAITPSLKRPQICQAFITSTSYTENAATRDICKFSLGYWNCFVYSQKVKIPCKKG